MGSKPSAHSFSPAALDIVTNHTVSNVESWRGAFARDLSDVLITTTAIESATATANNKTKRISVPLLPTVLYQIIASYVMPDFDWLLACDGWMSKRCLAAIPTVPPSWANNPLYARDVFHHDRIDAAYVPVIPGPLIDATWDNSNSEKIISPAEFLHVFEPRMGRHCLRHCESKPIAQFVMASFMTQLRVFLECASAADPTVQGGSRDGDERRSDPFVARVWTSQRAVRMRQGVRSHEYEAWIRVIPLSRAEQIARYQQQQIDRRMDEIGGIMKRDAASQTLHTAAASALADVVPPSVLFPPDPNTFDPPLPRPLHLFVRSIREPNDDYARDHWDRAPPPVSVLRYVP